MQAWLQKVSAEYYNNYDSAVNVGRPGCREFLQNNITINDFADNFGRPGCRKFLQNSITINDSADNFGMNLNLNNNQNLLQKIDFQRSHESLLVSKRISWQFHKVSVIVRLQNFDLESKVLDRLKNTPSHLPYMK